MDRQDSDHQPLQRKKIWEIDECFKCALIGTCLSRGELRKLGREKVYAIGPASDDYLLHSQFIGIAGQQDPKGKSLHKYLEKKYRTATRKYFLVATDEEVKKLWVEDLAEGRIDSAWWAVMTHPLASQDLVAQLYREVHMLGYDCVGSSHKKKVLIGDLRARVASLEEVLGSDRQSYLREKRQLKEEISGLAMERDGHAAGHAALVRENHQLRAQMAALSERIVSLNPAWQANEELRRRNSDLQAGIDGLTVELEAMKEQHRILKQRLSDQAGEIAALEAILLHHPVPASPCAICADQNTANCPGLNLCGRTVLYVGGLNRMVPHYRQMVENSGGRFIHHDGGREVSRSLLPKMLLTADAVFCPIDCVSHDACNCVKTMCKRYRKPFVLMRSASLSSLAKGLSDIVQ
ncbi:MAG: hypothetical protein ACD_75C00859G0003 [uncultured bacterium]|nr:MAG: hypothetical protein ACD_75C00859G0003 [uncultured bacterium]